MDTSADAPRLVAADSFRVRVSAGRAEVRGLALHLERFRWAVADAARRGGLRHDGARYETAGPSLEVFLGEARAEIAAYGEGFPRLECWLAADGTLSFGLSLRPLPKLFDTLALGTEVSDPATAARRKGPNISRYAALNAQHGCEALLVDPGGQVREGATTSLILWPTDDSHPGSGIVVAHTERVASVTERLLRREVLREPTAPLDTTYDVPRWSLGESHITVDALRNHEVWAVNALHGIRPVSHLDDIPLPGANPERLEHFRAALDSSREPLLG